MFRPDKEKIISFIVFSYVLYNLVQKQQRCCVIPHIIKKIFSFLPFKSIIHVTSVYLNAFSGYTTNDAAVARSSLVVVVVNETKEQDRWMDGKEEKHHFHHPHQTTCLQAYLYWMIIQNFFL